MLPAIDESESDDRREVKNDRGGLRSVRSCQIEFLRRRLATPNHSGAIASKSDNRLQFTYSRAASKEVDRNWILLVEVNTPLHMGAPILEALNYRRRVERVP